MPRRKKDPSVRARRNKASTSAKLTRVTEPTTNLAAYRELTVAQLKSEIDRRNDDGRPDSAKMSKAGAKAVLVDRLAADDSPIPRIPERADGWHARTIEWWTDVWSSPMSPEWDDSDVHNVYLLAMLYDDMWRAETPKARKEAAAEFRLQRADLGLSPYSRRRLEWTIETADEAKDRGDQRRSRRPTTPAAPAAAQTNAADPRAVLASVK